MSLTIKTVQTIPPDDTTQPLARAALPAHPPELDFYSLEDNTMGRDWAS
jgi:hypothetical protein